jgi:hypothetical protein
VIATGFGPDTSMRSGASTVAQTPIDMTPYTDGARARAGAISAAAPDLLAPPRLSITRRPLFELPLPAAGLQAAPLMTAAAGIADGAVQATESNPDFDLSSTFDVPAFLRRQES